MSTFQVLAFPAQIPHSSREAQGDVGFPSGPKLIFTSWITLFTTLSLTQPHTHFTCTLYTALFRKGATLFFFIVVHFSLAASSQKNLLGFSYVSLWNVGLVVVGTINSKSREITVACNLYSHTVLADFFSRSHILIFWDKYEWNTQTVELCLQNITKWLCGNPYEPMDSTTI